MVPSSYQFCVHNRLHNLPLPGHSLSLSQSFRRIEAVKSGHTYEYINIIAYSKSLFTENIKSFGIRYAVLPEREYNNCYYCDYDLFETCWLTSTGSVHWNDVPENLYGLHPFARRSSAVDRCVASYMRKQNANTENADDYYRLFVRVWMDGWHKFAIN